MITDIKNCQKAPKKTKKTWKREPFLAKGPKKPWLYINLSHLYINRPAAWQRHKAIGGKGSVTQLMNE